MAARRKRPTTAPIDPRPKQATPAPPPARPSFAAGWQVCWLAIPLAAVLIAYGGSYEAPLIFDDEYTITSNQQLHQYSNPIAAGLAASVGLPHSTLTNRPITAITFAFNWMSGGPNMHGYHVLNIIIHLLAVAALWDLTRLTLLAMRMKAGEIPSPRSRVSAGRWATLVALLWGVHPLLTEPVVYLTQRTTLLSGLFMLLTLDLSCRAWLMPRRRTLNSVAACVTCLCGVLSKEIAVCTPILVVLYDAAFLSPSWNVAWRRRWSLYAGLAASWLALLAFILAAPSNPTVGFAAAAQKGYTGWDYLKTQAWAIGTYVQLSFWPTPLRLVYSLEPVRELSRVVTPGLLIIAALVATGIGVALRRWWGWLGACFFLILAPTSSFMPIVTELVAERVMYLPLAVIVVFVVMAVRVLSLRAASITPALAQPAGFVVAGLGIALSAALVMATQRRVEDYQTEVSIWTDTVNKAPDNHTAHTNLGRSLFSIGDLKGAEREYLLAARDREAVDAHVNLSALYNEQGKFDEAVSHGKYAVEHNTRDRPEYHTNLSLPLAALGKFDEAERECKHAIQTAPWFGPGYNCLGITYAMQGRFSEAEPLFRKAMELDPTSPKPYFNLATSTINAGTKDGKASTEALQQAEGYLRKCLQIFPKEAEAHKRLAGVLLQQGRQQEALAEYRIAAQLNPYDGTIVQAIQALTGS
ncbi:MAG: tetratricopeptide repeat protein [Planctomycetes bacterium]|nr:tetratricopeptide repeat protein [Planctomycetota bacterium]